MSYSSQLDRAFQVWLDRNIPTVARRLYAEEYQNADIFETLPGFIIDNYHAEALRILAPNLA